MLVQACEIALAADLQLEVDAVQMALHGAFRHAETLRDLLVLGPRDDYSSHARLGVREPRRWRSGRGVAFEHMVEGAVHRLSLDPQATRMDLVDALREEA